MTKRTSSVERLVFWPAAVIVLAFSGFTLAAPRLAEVAFDAIQSSIVNAFNWYYVLITAFFVAFALFLGFSRFGDIRLGRMVTGPSSHLVPGSPYCSPRAWASASCFTG